MIILFVSQFLIFLNSWNSIYLVCILKYSIHFSWQISNHRLIVLYTLSMGAVKKLYIWNLLLKLLFQQTVQYLFPIYCESGSISLLMDIKKKNNIHGGNTLTSIGWKIPCKNEFLYNVISCSRITVAYIKMSVHL